MSEHLSKALQASLQAALGGPLQPEPEFRGGTMTGFVVVSRWVGPEGEPFYLVNESVDADVPQVLGWLEYAKEVIRSQMQKVFRE
jgi:hypothetical protein